MACGGGSLETAILESGRILRRKVTACTSGRMEIGMKENGLIA